MRNRVLFPGALLLCVLWLLGGCMPYQAELGALSRMGFSFPPPGPSTSIHFGSGVPGDTPTPELDDKTLRRAMPHLKRLPNLYLDLGGTDITDASLPTLARMTNLKGLNVRGTRVTGRGLVMLGPRRNWTLRTLSVDPPQLTPEQAESLRRAMPKLRIAVSRRGLLVPYGSENGAPYSRQWGE
jgi:hypothetical protein